MKPATITIIISTLIAFIAQQLFPITDILKLDAHNYHIYMLITAMFMHAGFLHFFYNMVGVLFFGTFLERIIGAKNLIVIYLTAGILANIVGLYLYDAALGASAALFGLIGCLAILRPKQIGVWGTIPLPVWAISVIYIVIDIFGLYLISTTAHAAHLVGIATGIIIGVAIKKHYPTPKQGKKMKIPDATFKAWEDTYMR